LHNPLAFILGLCIFTLFADNHSLISLTMNAFVQAIDNLRYHRTHAWTDQGVSDQISDIFIRGIKRQISQIFHGQFVKANKGYFYVSVFFRVKGQYFNAFVSDFRNGPTYIVVRRCESPEDYTGEINKRYRFSTSFARWMQLTFKEAELKRTEEVSTDVCEAIVTSIAEGTDKELTFTVSSQKKARAILFRVQERVNSSSSNITIWKMGRTTVRICASSEELDLEYDPTTKKLTYRA